MNKESIELINSKIILEFSASDPYSDTREKLYKFKVK